MQLKNFLVLLAGATAATAAVLPRDLPTILNSLKTASTAVSGFNAAVKAFGDSPSLITGAGINAPQQALNDALLGVTKAFAADGDKKPVAAESTQIITQIKVVGFSVQIGLQQVLNNVDNFKKIGAGLLVSAGLTTLHENWVEFLKVAPKRLTDQDWEDSKTTRDLIEAATRNIFIAFGQTPPS